ncbi:Serine/threonine-protein kinase mTOR [Liparis tanakae]|uniref:Serine/threonine-protein kinase mTOR n=1 Tax=Liparis tanakae TaxID=230148 RepID=A0A4Z2FPT7_9TELE|nr:Serine/threonine-protein kinase mTOR [Liparis tanakae]
MQNTIILLIEQIVVALGGEFKLYLPQLIPHMLRVFMHDNSTGRSVTIKMLNAIQLFGANLDDYLHLLLPPIVKLFDASDVTLQARKSQCQLLLQRRHGAAQPVAQVQQQVQQRSPVAPRPVAPGGRQRPLSGGEGPVRVLQVPVADGEGGQGGHGQGGGLPREQLLLHLQNRLQLLRGRPGAARPQEAVRPPLLPLREEGGEVRRVASAACGVEPGQVVLEAEAARRDHVGAEVPGEEFPGERHLFQLLGELLLQFVVEARKRTCLTTYLDRCSWTRRVDGTSNSSRAGRSLFFTALQFCCSSLVVRLEQLGDHCASFLDYCASFLDYCASFLDHWTSFLDHCASFLDYCASFLNHCASFLDYCASFLDHCASILDYCTSFLNHCASFLDHYASFLDYCASFLDHCASFLDYCASFLNHCASFLDYCASFLDYWTSFLDHCASILDYCTSFLNHCASFLDYCASFLPGCSND